MLTLAEEPPGTFALCPVCWWEDDPVQYREPNRRGGANGPSLIEAQRHYREIGASDPVLQDCVRPPNPDELPAGRKG